MTRQETVTDALAKAGRNIKSRIREAVFDILDLVWAERSDKFAFADNEDIDAEVNRILQLLSDGFLEDAIEAAKDLLKAVGDDAWEDDAIEYANEEIDGESTIFRFDMEASHLKELLEGWIIVSVVYGLSKWQVWTNLQAYLANPTASELWRGAGLGALKWGKGYMNNIVEGVKRIQHDFMNRAYQYAELRRFEEEGAIGYTVHRGSTFNCPLCDSYLGKVYPLDQIILPLHPNCVCWTEPVFINE